MDKTLTINGVDFSSYVQWEVGRNETTRRVYGPNGVVDIDGTEYPDLLGTKLDPVFLLKPMPKSMMQAIYGVIQQNTVTLVYSSFSDNSDRTITAIPQDLTFNFAMQGWDGEIYTGTGLSFREA